MTLKLAFAGSRMITICALEKFYLQMNRVYMPMKVNILRCSVITFVTFKFFSLGPSWIGNSKRNWVFRRTTRELNSRKSNDKTSSFKNEDELERRINPEFFLEDYIENLLSRSFSNLDAKKIIPSLLANSQKRSTMDNGRKYYITFN